MSVCERSSQLDENAKRQIKLGSVVSLATTDACLIDLVSNVAFRGTKTKHYAACQNC